jgi:ferredoxin
MKLTIDTEICTGHGRCYVVAPDLFDSDDDGRGVVLRAEVPPELEPSARTAEASCPERAVRLS